MRTLLHVFVTNRFLFVNLFFFSAINKMCRRQRSTETNLCTLELWRDAKARVEAGEGKRMVAK